MIRRILNISEALPWEETVRHLNEYSYMLFISGYNDKEGYSNIKGAIERAEQFDREIEAGTRESKYRNGEQIRNNKIEKGGLTPATWFLTKEVSSTISYPATQGSILATMLSRKLGISSNGRRKVELWEG